MLRWLSRPWVLASAWSELRVALRLMREPSVPWSVKTILGGAGLYLLSPLDVLPDLLPVLGQLDDVALVIAAITVFLRACPPAAVAFHRAALLARRPYAPMPAADVVIDAEFRRG